MRQLQLFDDDTFPRSITERAKKIQPISSLWSTRLFEPKDAWEGGGRGFRKFIFKCWALSRTPIQFLISGKFCPHFISLNLLPWTCETNILQIMLLCAEGGAVLYRKPFGLAPRASYHLYDFKTSFTFENLFDLLHEVTTSRGISGRDSTFKRG